MAGANGLKTQKSGTPEGQVGSSFLSVRDAVVGCKIGKAFRLEKDSNQGWDVTVSRVDIVALQEAVKQVNRTGEEMRSLA